jgi:hypothetical protein
LPAFFAECLYEYHRAGFLGVSPLYSALRPGFARVDHARDVRVFIPLVEAAHAVANDAIGGGDALAGA